MKRAAVGRSATGEVLQAGRKQLAGEQLVASSTNTAEPSGKLTKRLQRIKDSIDSGTYAVSADQVARAMMRYAVGSRASFTSEEKTVIPSA